MAWMVNCLTALCFLDWWSEFCLLWENTGHSTNHSVLKYMKDVQPTCSGSRERIHSLCTTDGSQSRMLWIFQWSFCKGSKQKHTDPPSARGPCRYFPNRAEKRNFWTTLQTCRAAVRISQHVSPTPCLCRKGNSSNCSLHFSTSL